MKALRTLLLVAALVDIHLVVRAQNGGAPPWAQNWQFRDTGNSGWGLNAVTWGNQLYVAVGDFGTILTSPDGIHWTARRSGAAQNLNGVTFASNGSDSLFIATGRVGTILLSHDGTNWEPRTIEAFGGALYGVTYAQNKIVIVGEANGAISEDFGQTFSQTAMWGGERCYGVGYGKGKFVATGGWRSRQIFASGDGKAWDRVFLEGPESQRYWSVAFADGIGFLAVGHHVNWPDNTGDFYNFSTDGGIWKEGTRGSPYSMFGLTFGDDVFISVGNQGQVSITVDGSLWQHFATGTDRRLLGVTFGGGQFVSVGQDGVIMTSPHGNTWDIRVQPIDGGPTREIHGVTGGPNGYVAVGSKGAILRSTDGITWKIQDSGTGKDLWDVTYSAGHYLIAGNNGLLLESQSGDTWNTVNSGTDKTLYRIHYLNGQFICAGDAGTVLTSPNGVDYALHTAGSNLRDVEYALGRYVAAGEGGALFVSTDAAEWRQLSLGNNSHIFSVRFGNGIFLAVGRDGVAWASTDGELWRPRPNTGNNLNALDFGNGVFLAVGENSAVLTSTDGKSWNRTDLGFPGRTFYGAQFIQDTALIVGQYASIFQASDVPTTGSGPVITTQPTTQLVTVGGEATLVVEVSGQGPFAYQWYLNGAPVEGATGSSLTLTNLTLDNTGKYTVKVSNSAGSVTSAPAVLVGTPDVDLELYAGLTLTGTLGQTYGIEYATELQGNNTAWRGLDQVTLTNKAQLWFDLGSSKATKRFYRATPVF